MQVYFNHRCCLIEKGSQVIVRGRREGRMVILYLNDVKSAAMFAKRQQSRHRQRATTHDHRPPQSPKAQEHAVKKSQSSDYQPLESMTLKEYVKPTKSATKIDTYFQKR